MPFIESTVFPLAMMGFVGLAICAVAAAFGRRLQAISAVTAIVVAVHVFLVWQLRYEWSLAQATRNGWAGFAIFHTALITVVVMPLAGQNAARRLSTFAFCTVCAGALGAVFRYGVVAGYRAGVIATAAIGVCALALGYRNSRRPRVW